MEFCQSVFGGTLDIATFADLHRAQSAGQEHLIAHSIPKGTAGVILMGSDAPTPKEHRSGGSFSVALGGDEADLTQYWGGLTEGGTVTVPFAVRMGRPARTVRRQFSTAWLLNVTANSAA